MDNKEKLQAALDAEKARALQLEPALELASENLKQSLLPYFAGENWAANRDFYTLILSLPATGSPRYDDRRLKISAKFSERAYLPSAKADRETLERAAFYNSHDGHAELFAERDKWSKIEQDLSRAYDKARQNYSERNGNYNKVNQGFQRVTQTSLATTDRSIWEGWSIGKVAQFIFSRRYRNIRADLGEVQNMYGASAFDLHALSDEAKTQNDAACEAYNALDRAAVNASYKLARQANDYVSTADRFTENSIVPLFGDTDFLQKARDVLDDPVYEDARQYNATYRAIEASLQLQRVLAVVLADKPAKPDEKPDSPRDGLERQRERLAEDVASFIGEAEIKQTDERNPNQDTDISQRILQQILTQQAIDQLNRMASEAERITEEDRELERRERLEEAIRRRGELGLGRDRRDRDYDIGR